VQPSWRVHTRRTDGVPMPSFAPRPSKPAQGIRPQGRERAGLRVAPVGADREGPPRSGVRDDARGEWVALSFVQSVQDIEELRKIVGKSVMIMAKTEKPAAITDIVAILRPHLHSPVARGDHNGMASAAATVRPPLM